MALDETSLTKGNMYTLLTNRHSKGQKGTIAAIIKGTRVDPIYRNVKSFPRMMIKEITLDIANTVDWIARHIAPNACKTLDRFHVERLVFDALQSLRIRHRWTAIEKEENFNKKTARLESLETGILISNCLLEADGSYSVNKKSGQSSRVNGLRFFLRNILILNMLTI